MYLRAALLLFAVFLLGVFSAETKLPTIRLRSPILIIDPNGRPADETDQLILLDTCTGLRRI